MPFEKGNVPWNKGNVTPKDKEKGRESQRRYIKRNRKKERERSRLNQKNNPEYNKQYALRRLYGLSHEDWLKMWENQDGRCVICGKKFSNPAKAFVDHNHDTKKIRGLLCCKCNFGIGYFDENIEIMAKAIEYLKY